MKRLYLIPWIGAAILCMTSAQVPAQSVAPQLAPPFATAPDVDPGIDHGNSDANLPEQYQKQLVFYRSLQPPGTIIIDTHERHLYLIKDETHALRYGIGVGRDGFTWQGLLQISRKAEWPDWRPPPEMIERQTFSSTLHGRWAGKSARRARHVSGQYRLPHPRY